jgi:hypothetical protein
MAGNAPTHPSKNEVGRDVWGGDSVKRCSCDLVRSSVEIKVLL